MSWKALYRKTNYLLLLSLTEIVKLVLRFFSKDAVVFFKRYPFLSAEPREAWHYFKLCCGDIIQYIALKRPHFFSVVVKLGCSFSFAISFSVILFAVYSNTHQQQNLIQQQTELSQFIASQAADSLKIPVLVNNNTDINTLIEKWSEHPKIMNIAIYNESQQLIHFTGTTEQQHKLAPQQAILPANEVINWTHLFKIFYQPFTDATKNHWVTYTVAIQYNEINIGFLSLTFDHSLLKISQSQSLHDLIIVLMLSLVMAFFFAFYVSRSVTKPLIDLLNAGDSMSKLNEPHSEPRRKDELEVLIDSMNSMNQGVLHKDKVEAVFSRYVSEQVAKQVLKDLDNIDDVELGGQHLMASVFFADIVGFTSLSESLDPEDVSELLNVYFSKVNEVVSFCGGHVDKYIGDCAMVVFGVPEINENHAFDCVACGWMILELLEQLNQKRQSEGERTVDFRIGMNSGMMLAGNMGSNERMEYTVVGDSVNLASRLCGTGDPGELIMTEDVFIEQSLEGQVSIEIKDFIKLRGKRLPVKTLMVEDILTPFKEDMLNEIPKIIATSTTQQ